tara:strand:- start:763 stop:942 length:180 start_codon:yes stop_codon:yes gene_type:complete
MGITIAILIGIGIAIWIGYELYEAPVLDDDGNVVDIKDMKNIDIMESDIESDFKNGDGL